MTTPAITPRQQLEAVIRRQIAAQAGRPATPFIRLTPDALIEASTRTILAAVDDWADQQLVAGPLFEQQLQEVMRRNPELLRTWIRKEARRSGRMPWRSR